MRNIILAAVAAVGLSGCTSFGGYGSGVSVGVGSGGYGGYGGYSPYASNSCIAYDSFGRMFYGCGVGGGFYSPRRIYYYPGYRYSGGFYYDAYNRPFSSRYMYDRYYRYRRY